MDVPLRDLPSHIVRPRHMNEDPHEADTAAKERRPTSAHDVEKVLTKAARRDAVAASRDSTAGKRDMAANMTAWLTNDEGGADAEARREALGDRLHSASDRAESATDLDALATMASSRTTEDDDPTAE